MLRDARHAAGIHIEALAVALKVPVSKLEALEADNYQVLPDAVFVRALASSVCRSLKIDPKGGWRSHDGQRQASGLSGSICLVAGGRRAGLLSALID
jgi:cytoskeletal protein RodZ